MVVASGCIVRLEYELRVRMGELIESSARSGPLTYRHGEGAMLPGLEARLEGMAVGQEKAGVILAADAFGTAATAPAEEMDRSAFGADADVAPGRVFDTADARGRKVKLRIESVSGERVTVRVVHPLAGKDIEFRVRVLSIDDPRARLRESVSPPPAPAEAVVVPEPDEE